MSFVKKDCPREGPTDSINNTAHSQSSYSRTSFDCEDLDRYETGGFHPVDVRGRIHDRYEILHKLGYGGTATVWLARDHEAVRNVALKILTADHTADSGGRELAAYEHLRAKLPTDQQHLIVRLYDSFTIQGPNGTHLCLSLGLSGPSLADIVGRDASMKIRPDVCQQLGLQVARGLSEIHKTGITYNDFTPSNILLGLDETIATLSESELYARLGHPKTHPLPRPNDTTDGSSKSHAPTHVYSALNFTDADKLSLLQPVIKFIDFAEVRYIGEPAPDAHHGLTLLYSDPEALFWRQKQTQASDIWSLACILFELRACDTLILPGSCGLEDVKSGILECIGPMPEEWRRKILEEAGGDCVESVDGDAGADRNEQPTTTTWQFDDSDFGELGLGEERTGLGGPVERKPGRRAMHRVRSLVSKLKQAVGALFRRRPAVDAKASDPIPYILYEGLHPTRKSLQKAVHSIGTSTPWCHMSVEERVQKLMALHETCRNVGVEVTRAECDTGEPPHEALSIEEARDFVELLAMMLTWRRDERGSLEDVLRHRWFTEEYGCVREEPWLQRYHRGYQYFVNGEQLV